jgi:hypothetical protein
MPEFISEYNKGLSDFHAEHIWVTNFIWQFPRASTFTGVWDAVLNGWQTSGIVRMRSGNPLTPFLQSNRSRSQWAPSLGPGTGPDRPSYAPGRGPGNAGLGRPDRWLDPAALAAEAAWSACDFLMSGARSICLTTPEPFSFRRRVMKTARNRLGLAGLWDELP